MSSKIATELATSMFANGKWCLAPMVRCGTLPLRLLSLKYGASTVWGPEIIDHKLPQCTRIENTKLGTVDFLMPNGSLCFRTKRSLEKGKLVFQLGSSSKESAIKGAEVIAKDVDALDINMGCPKSFSIKGGMGAALLKKADVACDIISGLKAKFPDMPITCKIRLLDTTEERLVSVDFNHNSNSAIVDLSLTNVVGKNMGKISAWYDNEWGFASRMNDLAAYIHKI